MHVRTQGDPRGSESLCPSPDPRATPQNPGCVSHPSNFKNIGDGHTIADQINVVLEPYDLGAIAASNDRIGSWQLMYQMLQKGERQVADTCPKLIEAIPSHTHDEKKPGDVVVCLPHLADEDLNVRANGFVRGSQSQKGMLHNWLGGSRIM